MVNSKLAPFPIDQERTGLTIAYRNAKYIADQISLRRPVGKQEFTYNQISAAQSFRQQDTKVGRRGKPNEVQYFSEEKTAATEDFGLDDPIPQLDIDNAAMGTDPIDESVEQLTDDILLDREIEVADKVFDLNTYHPDLRETLSGTSQFSDYTNSNPILKIKLAASKCLERPNCLVVGRGGADYLTSHPKVLTAVAAQVGQTGIEDGTVTLQALAQAVGVDRVLVGEAWKNVAPEGLAQNLQRVWSGAHLSLIHVNPLATLRRGVTFSLTAQLGQRQAGVKPDDGISVRGGQRVRVYESRKLVIIASLAGFFFENAFDI